MRFQRPLNEVFHGAAATRVARVLALFPTREFTGRELAQEAGIAPSNAIAELNRFLQQGLVRRRIAGRSQLWKLNVEHALGEKLTDLFEFEYSLGKELRQRIAHFVRRIPGLERAVLFGSVVRGDETETSDVDLLLVVRHPRDKEAAMDGVSTLRHELRTRFGNRLQPVIYALAEWGRRKGPGLIRNIEREGEVVWERSA